MLCTADHCRTLCWLVAVFGLVLRRRSALGLDPKQHLDRASLVHGTVAIGDFR